MIQVEITSPDDSIKLLQLPDDCIIGKGAQSELRLDSWRISKEHARLFITPAGILLEDLGAFSGVYVNEQRIESQYGPLKELDVITIGPFKIRATILGQGAEFQLAPKNSNITNVTPRPQLASEQVVMARTTVEKTQTEAVLVQSNLTLTETPIKHNPEPTNLSAAVTVDASKKEREFEWRKKIHTRLLETIDLRRQNVAEMSDDILRSSTNKLIEQIIAELKDDIPNDLDQLLLQKQVLDEAVGLGPLEELLADDSVSEVMVNRFDEIFVERSGRVHRHPLTFTGDRAVMGVIERIVAPLGRRIDESSPMVDARLKDGSRVNAIIPPLALKGPCLTIRKFSKRKLVAQDLVNYGSISSAMAEFLKVCVVTRKNMIVSGGTGSGKTTLLNILSNFIPGGERIITVEDAAELKLDHEHLISLESRPANAEGKGAIMIRDLVKNTLRMRPDRIVVGECRGAEALDMLQAMNTGHEGSLTTLHANTPRDGLARLETMVLMAGMDLPLIAIREQICSAVDIVVQQTRFSCGTRMVTSITEVTGIESGKIQIQELFKFHSLGYGSNNQDGTGPGKIRGYFTGCDMVPTFYEELRATGNNLDMSIFKPYDPNQNLANEERGAGVF